MSEAKAKLRKQILFNRRLLDRKVFASRSLALNHQVFAFVQQHSRKCVHCFLPIERNKEVNTWPLIELLSAMGIQVVVSATDFDNEQMNHFLYNDSLNFKEDRFNIPTPINGQKADIKSIDCVVIPLLAADKKGNRIGYGKGYYDRLLTDMRSDVLKIGLNLGPTFDSFTFAEAHDVSLDYLITPFEIIDYNE